MAKEEKLIDIIVTEDVTCKPKILDEYSKDIGFVNTVRPECMVKPRNTDDVESLVRSRATPRITGEAKGR